MTFRIVIALLVSLLVASPSASLAQKPATVLERNIRAELGFLASDAMQGRGSGTGYERLAAEYIGSQFRQFGLEPAGDTDGSGQKGFVQRAILSGLKFTEAPTLTVTAGTDVKKWQFGKDFLISFLRSQNISGKLQIIDADGTFTKGAVSLVKLPDGADGQKRQDIVRKARAAQAAGVLLIESDLNKRTRESGNTRLPNLPTRIQSEASSDSSFAMIALSKQAYDEIAAINGVAKVEFSGPTQSAAESFTWNAGCFEARIPKLLMR